MQARAIDNEVRFIRSGRRLRNPFPLPVREFEDARITDHPSALGHNASGKRCTYRAKIDYAFLGHSYRGHPADVRLDFTHFIRAEHSKAAQAIFLSPVE